MARAFSYATFKGIRFELMRHEDEFRRKIIRHALPHSSEALYENNGTEEDGFVIQGFLCGPDASFSADLLRKKLREDRSGTLVHPLLGLRHVLCRAYSTGEDFTAAGRISLKLEFTEIPAEAESLLIKATESLRKGQDWIESSVIRPFTDSLELIRMPSFVLASAVQTVTNLHDFLRSENGAGVFASEATEGLKQVQRLREEAFTLLSTPAELAKSMIRAVTGLASVSSSFAIFSRMKQPGASELHSRSRAERAVAANQRAFVILTGLSALMAAAEQSLTEEERAQALRLCGEIPEHPADDRSFSAVSELRRQLEEREALAIPEFSQELPSLVLLHRAGLSDRDEEAFLRRNRLRSPFRLKGRFYVPSA
ncbi:MAG: DNA circularization N-terminal domain-containing protein [Deltaproteobacteria bacterium]|nr:DNA circularization N-terminal domain-containing protein [Deltaproteobacteria bacterium]MCB9229977.1 DNA circularization N-terminal domain-containing protein [Deltaproteobacteria bacterium]